MVATKTLIRLNAQLRRPPRDSQSGTGNRSHTGWLTVLAVLALTASTWIALIVSGGVLMFVERRALPLTQFPPEAHVDAMVLDYFVFLAGLACVFVIPPLVSLIAQSAALGASVHQYRLAALRLMGLTTGDVVRMTLINTTRHTLIGLVLGTALSICTAPAWSLLSFQGLQISPWEMLLPWWGYPLVWAVVLILTLFAALVGLGRVLITPLGVSRRQVPQALRWWRVLVFCVLFGAGVIYLSSIDMKTSTHAGWIVIGLILLVLVSSISIIGPLLLQLTARLSTFLPGSTNFVATRRVATHGKQTWRRVSTPAFLSLLLGYMSLAPLPTDSSVPNSLAITDILNGMVLTVVIGLVITLISTLLTQALAVYEEAELTGALDFIGAPLSLHRRVSFRQTLVPMLIAGGFGYILGAVLSGMMFSPYVEEYSLTQVGKPLIIFLLSILAVSSVAFVVEPLRRQVLQNQTRPND